MKKVLVAMSGGVDSSVAAALLQKQGYFVMGGYMKNFSAESWQGVLQAECPWQQDVRDVEGVCKTLGIEYRSFNFEKEYREIVIEYFFKEYAAGRTPNPDIMCNKEIKFKLFSKVARELGFDYIATGHYAQIKQNPDGTYELHKGRDEKKDQSYFLYALNQGQLAKTLFPVGRYTKTQTRALARKFKLPNAAKKDSQGICFVGHVNLREFLRQRIPERAGKIVDPSGRVLGEHPGAWYYTIGQRHGLGLGGGLPYYVVQKDVKKNQLTVDTKQHPKSLYSKIANLTNLHWINKSEALPFLCQAKIRYQQPEQDCKITKARNGMQVKFSKPQFAIAPGQAIVFYKGQKILGGGIIK